jgi:hypothetical protein
MKHALLAMAMVAGCKAGNFLTVDVIGIPCEASSLHVTLELDGGSISEHTFTNPARIGDGETSFAVDLGGHGTGVLLVTVEATNSTGQFSGSASASLPAGPAGSAGSVTIDLHQGGSCGTIDAGVMPDAGVTLDADRSCGWNVEPTNYAPCAADFPPATGPFEITGIQALNTDTQAGAFNSVVYQLTGEVLLIHATSFAIPSGTTLLILGTRPLLIVVDGDATIAGTIDLSGAAEPTDCPIIMAEQGSSSGPGGAGGGFVTQGGGGGANGDNMVPGPPGGGAIGNSLLSPLRPGCPGGRGGRGALDPGGGGGNGGGALEISSNGTLELSGTIMAGGGGGNAGTVEILPVSGAIGGVSGGGGGGAGGAVLLEASVIHFDSATICAAGGGGGEGGDVDPGGMAGTRGTCTSGPGGTGSRGGDGGNGGDANAPGAGQIGSRPIGMSPETGGGGGGGSIGRIRVHGMQTGTATIVPPPTN